MRGDDRDSGFGLAIDVYTVIETQQAKILIFMDASRRSQTVSLFEALREVCGTTVEFEPGVEA